MTSLSGDSFLATAEPCLDSDKHVVNHQILSGKAKIDACTGSSSVHGAWGTRNVSREIVKSRRDRSSIQAYGSEIDQQHNLEPLKKRNII